MLATDAQGQMGLYLWFSGSTELYQYVLSGVDPAKQSDWGGGSFPFTTN